MANEWILTTETIRDRAIVIRQQQQLERFQITSEKDCSKIIEGICEDLIMMTWIAFLRVLS